MLSQHNRRRRSHNGRHRSTSDAYLQAGRFTSLVAVAAFTVAVGSAAASANAGHPDTSHLDTVALARATNPVPPAFLSRNAGLYVSRSQHRAGLSQNMVEVISTAPVQDGLPGVDTASLDTASLDTASPDTARRQEALRVATPKTAADAARVARTVRAQVVKAKAAKVRAAHAMDARKAQALAAQIEAVEVAIEAKRDTRTSPGPTTAATAAAKVWAGREVRRMGYETVQFTCLDKLWTRESGWNPRADNPTSTAYGIPQSLPGSKMAAAGADWRVNPKTQMAWGLRYIKARYGDPCHAWAHSEKDNWY